MGATNALAAYRLYAGKVPPLSMQLLAFMALVSKDDDAEPCFWMGHEALAELALGRKPPLTRKDIAAVERAMTPLHRVRAIVTIREAAPRRDGASTAKYALDLRVFTPRIPRGEHPTESVSNVPRKSEQRPTESVSNVPRGPWDRGDRRRQEERGEETQLTTEPSHSVTRAASADETATLALLTAWAKVEHPDEAWPPLVRQLLILDCEPANVVQQVANMGESVSIPDRFGSVEGLLKKVQAPWPTSTGAATRR